MNDPNNPTPEQRAAVARLEQINKDGRKVYGEDVFDYGTQRLVQQINEAKERGESHKVYDASRADTHIEVGHDAINALCKDMESDDPALRQRAERLWNQYRGREPRRRG
jgi:hypothetical protein